MDEIVFFLRFFNNFKPGIEYTLTDIYSFTPVSYLKIKYFLQHLVNEGILKTELVPYRPGNSNRLGIKFQITKRGISLAKSLKLLDWNNLQ